MAKDIDFNAPIFDKFKNGSEELSNLTGRRNYINAKLSFLDYNNIETIKYKNNEIYKQRIGNKIPAKRI